MIGVKRSLRRGISELIIILLILAIAIPIVLILQSWLSNQVSTLPTIEKIRGVYSVEYLSPQGTLVTLTVFNDGRSIVNISDIKIIYTTSGPTTSTNVTSVCSSTDTSMFKMIDPSSGCPVTISPGSSQVVTMESNNTVSIQKILIVVSSSDNPAAKRTIEISG